MTAIQERLFALQDADYAAFQRPLMPAVEEEVFIGVRTPALRSLAKELRGSAEAEAFLVSLPHVYFEENQLPFFPLWTAGPPAISSRRKPFGKTARH